MAFRKRAAARRAEAQGDALSLPPPGEGKTQEPGEPEEAPAPAEKADKKPAKKATAKPKAKTEKE